MAHRTTRRGHRTSGGRTHSPSHGHWCATASATKHKSATTWC